MEQLSSEKRERPQMLHEATWIHLLDSGGQPQFTDLLRMFVRGNSLYIIVMKVTESLHDKPTFVFSIEGKPLNAPKEMTMTNLQIIERFVRSVAATSREDNSEPAFAIVATHCDQRSKYKQFLGSEESIEMKNKTLQSHLSDFLHLFVFYNHNSDELIFPVNNLCQENREKLSADICNRLVSDVRFNINIPVRWYAFDLDIKNEASKETHGMISLESCYSIGQRLEMDKEEVERCLIYLDSMRLCIYYHKLLPHVVFTNLQFLIDCLSNIVCVSFVDKLKKILPNGTIISEKIIHLLRYNGTFDQTLLDSLGLTFIHNLFSKKDLLLLLQKFRVISSIETPQDDAKYFIPILLPAESLSEKSKNLIATNSVPLFITFDNKLMLQGLFPTLVVSLLGREEEPKFFIDSRTFEFPRQLRHAVKLYAPSLFAAVFLCENNESIDVYFTGCPQHCYHLRKVILEALSVSVKVLEYDESKLNMSALIRCNREHIERAHDKKNHPITISLDLSQIGCSVESSLPTIAISDLIERKRCWLIPTASVCEPAPLPVDDNALLNHTHAPAILDAIDSVVDEWQRLGQKLGISDKMLRQFKYNSRDQVQVCRKDMIYYWIDARCATCHKLKSALKSMGENGIVSEIQRLQTAK
ncbi:PREDICTED: uncharacterized protein LOC109591390 [Amphimedon queenslandica]|uniref:Death domain-containing protein n=1 Tax=Amphimedon queenslandica TaxID=400682 RepID=A0AAN0JZN4_AMPQE|nr:PREDICTED: uncharacterized protein LOC109591390 [Amphimedon queenslandica]|eukprot:XP_019862686.1 PREDICTED: uncharacterized protein LOC109591390 [Amphimedon queenslandica]